MHLRIEPVAVGDIHGGVLAPHEVEACVRKRQVERIALAIGDLVEKSRPARQHPGDFDELCREIESADAAAEVLGKKSGRPADAATDVEHVLATMDLRE